MRKFTDRWYLSMLIVPIVLTYLTDYIKLPIIFEKWEYSIIASMTILIGILLYELKSMSHSLKIARDKPKKADKIIVRKLLEILDIDKFHEEIVLQDAWNGYYRDDIHRIIEFQEKAKLIGYKTSNEEVNNLISQFVVKLDDFTQYSSVRVSSQGGWLVPFKDNPEIHPHEKIKKETEEMNALTQKCFSELEGLMKYLRDKDYI